MNARPRNPSAVARSALAGCRCGGRLPWAVLLLLGIGACAGRGAGRAGGDPRPQALARPLEIYGEMGLIAGPPQFPVVATLSTLAGPVDSTFVLLAMSLPNSALRFQREGAGFFAEYTVSALFRQDSATIGRLDRREPVRVGSFAETGRSEESVVFQQPVALPPGRYEVSLHAADVHSSRDFRVTDTLDVPAYGAAAGRLGTPLLVYRAEGRATRAEQPFLITNPRHAVPYGGESPRVYLESYGLPAEQPLAVRVVDQTGANLWSANATLVKGDSLIRYGVGEVPASALPLGRLWVEVNEPGRQPLRTPMVLTISDQWMVANFDEVLDFLRYIAYPDELDSLRAGTPALRREQWEKFWARRDPLPVTDINEYRDEFFQRVRYATEAFREPGGRAGWDTDRGEVYIVLGTPDQALERYINTSNMTGEPNAEEWLYSGAPGGRLTLLFIDRSGFGRYELAPSSASAFRGVAERMKPRRR
ncbi:MAG: GWxTD domain-containing protein [Gemmatimonadetes bacterium]|nr:GWxTD domain-containing protein [Gemmatimonadota bacterium]